MVDSVAFMVNRSDPHEELFSHSFRDDFTGQLFVTIGYREGRNHMHQDVQFYAVREGDETTVVIRRPGDACGVLEDMAGMDQAVTRFAGEVSLPAGTWSFHALHGSRVDCWSETDDTSNPVDGIRTRFEWCYE